MYRALGDHRWSLLAEELREWVLHSTSSRPPTSDTPRTSEHIAASQTAATVAANSPITHPTTSVLSTTIQMEFVTGDPSFVSPLTDESKSVYFHLNMYTEPVTDPGFS